MRRRGTVMVTVMVVTALAAMTAASLLFRTTAEVAAAGARRRGEQAYEAAMSGLQHATAVLVESANDPPVWRDNPDLFRNQLVYDDGAEQWYFTLYAPNAADPRSARYGLSDEAAKISINTATAETLAKMPNMTAELVDCLLDYRDRDSDTRSAGAEQDYYDQLPTPYVIKNGPLATLEELLLVKDFNGAILYGEDANMNGLAEPNETDGEESFPADNGDDVLDRGLRGVATALSYEPDVDRDGQPRININGDLNALANAGLPSQTVEFIELYRGEGKTFQHPVELLNLRYRLTRDAPRGGPRAGQWIDSGVTGATLAQVLEKLTVSRGPRLRDGTALAVGLVNVNTASAKVLSLVPGVDENLAQRIVDVRGELNADERSTTAWLFTENLTDDKAFVSIAPALTARSYQFRAQCIGFGARSGRFRIIEAVIDLAVGEPRVSYLRDLTRLGLPFALDIESEER